MAQGLNAILNLRAKLSAINDSLRDNTLVIASLSKPINEAQICELNSEQQLYDHGVNALGVDISDYQPYARFTVYVKRSNGQPSDRVTLRDNGDFHGSFFVKFGKDGLAIDATDSKRDKLVRKYGKQIFGLTPESKTYVSNEILKPELLDEIKAILYGHK